MSQVGLSQSDACVGAPTPPGVSGDACVAPTHSRCFRRSLRWRTDTQQVLQAMLALVRLASLLAVHFACSLLRRVHTIGELIPGAGVPWRLEIVLTWASRKVVGPSVRSSHTHDACFSLLAG